MFNRMSLLALICLQLALWGSGAGVAWPGGGLAQKYPGDVGLARDANVVFVEDFEAGSLEGVTARWESVKNRAGLSLSMDTPAGSHGGHSLLMTHIGGQGTGAHLYRRLLPGYDKLHVRFYVKFDPDCFGIHHFVHVGGYHPATAWPQGGAGTRPNGDERFSTGVEPFGDILGRLSSVAGLCVIYYYCFHVFYGT